MTILIRVRFRRFMPDFKPFVKRRKRYKPGYPRSTVYGLTPGGYYKGLYFNNTYELAYFLYMKDHGSVVRKHRYVFHYYTSGRRRTFSPDFIDEAGIFHEIVFQHEHIIPIKVAAINKAGFNIIIVRPIHLEKMIEWVLANYKVSTVLHLYDNRKCNDKRFTYTCGYCGCKFETDYRHYTLMVFCSAHCKGMYDCSRNRLIKYERGIKDTFGRKDGIKERSD